LNIRQDQNKLLKKKEIAMNLKLGINLGFAINRYIEPEIWAKIVGDELDLRHVQFVADLLNPFLPKKYINSQIKRIKTATKEYDISVEGLFTSAYTRVNHLMHPDAEAREIWVNWFKGLIDIGSQFGAKSCGSHFGTLTFASYDDPEKREFLIEEGVKNWQKLSFYAREKGYESLVFEPMGVPREMANTVKETKSLLERVNANCGVPMKVCLDVGHAPHPDERDPYPWIEQLGAESPIVHLQQTVLNKSNHAPFTEENNRDGIIKAEKVIAALERSGCKESLLAFEIGHREHFDTDFRIISDLKASVDYWRRYIKE
jgi:sugar phosphate isomerase/epimerase